MSWAVRLRPWDPALPEEGDSAGLLLGEPALASMALVRAFLSPRGTLCEEGKQDLGVGGCAAWRLVPAWGLEVSSEATGAMGPQKSAVLASGTL